MNFPITAFPHNLGDVAIVQTQSIVCSHGQHARQCSPDIGTHPETAKPQKTHSPTTPIKHGPNGPESPGPRPPKVGLVCPQVPSKTP